MNNDSTYKDLNISVIISNYLLLKTVLSGCVNMSKYDEMKGHLTAHSACCVCFKCVVSYRMQMSSLPLNYMQKK